MKKLLILLIIIISIASIANATHVVGGDFQINMVSQNATGADYQIKLRFYRDDATGSPTAVIPTTMDIGIYDAVTHQLEQVVVVNRTSMTILALGDACYTPDPNTTKIQEGLFESSVRYINILYKVIETSFTLF